MLDIFLEIIRAIVMGVIVAYLVWADRKLGLRQQGGWTFII